MKIHREPLGDKAQTANAMYKLITDYYKDLDTVYVKKDGKNMPVSKLSLKDYFNLVKRFPYKTDTKPKEIIARPYILFKEKDTGLDCKKKSILLGAYLKYHKIPFRLIGSSSRSDQSIHHVFPQLKLFGEWKNCDATYPDYKLYQPKEVTAYEIL